MNFSFILAFLLTNTFCFMANAVTVQYQKGSYDNNGLVNECYTLDTRNNSKSGCVNPNPAKTPAQTFKFPEAEVVPTPPSQATPKASTTTPGPQGHRSQRPTTSQTPASPSSAPSWTPDPLPSLTPPTNPVAIPVAPTLPVQTSPATPNDALSTTMVPMRPDNDLNQFLKNPTFEIIPYGDCNKEYSDDSVEIYGINCQVSVRYTQDPTQKLILVRFASLTIEKELPDETVTVEPEAHFESSGSKAFRFFANGHFSHVNENEIEVDLLAENGMKLNFTLDAHGRMDNLGFFAE